jgi:hypothetical protein
MKYSNYFKTELEKSISYLSDYLDVLLCFLSFAHFILLQGITSSISNSIHPVIHPFLFYYLFFLLESILVFIVSTVVSNTLINIDGTTTSILFTQHSMYTSTSTSFIIIESTIFFFLYLTKNRTEFPLLFLVLSYQFQNIYNFANSNSNVSSTI